MAESCDTMFSTWGIARETPQVTRLVHELRSGAECLSQRLGVLAPEEVEARTWGMIAEGVTEALTWYGTTPLGELCERALALRGGPAEVHERKLMRERARVALRLGSPLRIRPRTAGELLSLWDEATRSEPEIRLRVDVPRWREESDGLPFTGMALAWMRDPRPLPPGKKTATPATIPQLAGELVDFLASSDLPAEVVAAHVPHLLVYVHPFVDGNGHASRLLLSDLLFDAGYAAPTLIAYVDRFRTHAAEWAGLLEEVFLGEKDAEELVCFQLRLLIEAQENVLAQGGAQGFKGSI